MVGKTILPGDPFL